MKTLVIILAAFLVSSICYAFTSPAISTSFPPPDVIKSKTIFAINIYNDIMDVPYAETFGTEMTLLAEKGEYSIYSCETCHLNEIPGCPPKGQIHHYFVFKNNQFHLTVNECNKQAVYNFFVNM
jgi:exo-beta-1,3-glucanase (GH17 family)